MIGELVEDFNLVSFEVLSVENKQSMINLLSVIDKANGYSFGSEIGGDSIWSEATRQGGASGYAAVDIHERWIEYKDQYDQEERKSEERLEQSDNEGDATQPSMTEDEEWELAVHEWEKNRGASGPLSR